MPDLPVLLTYIAVLTGFVFLVHRSCSRSPGHQHREYALVSQQALASDWVTSSIRIWRLGSGWRFRGADRPGYPPNNIASKGE